MQASLLQPRLCAAAAPLGKIAPPAINASAPRILLAQGLPPPRTHQIRDFCVRAVAEQATHNGSGTPAPSSVVPVVKIDNQSDAFATIVSVEFGDKLGELLDTVAALRGLGLNIRRAKLQTTVAGAGGAHKFYITDAKTSEKVLKSAKLEEIRLTILRNMLQYHPESGEQLAWGSEEARSVSAVAVRDLDSTRPLGQRKRSWSTQVETRECESGAYTKLLVTTLDRPGLLTDIVRTLKDISLNVVSAEVDTVGRNAVDVFNVTYHGEPLPEPMCQLAVNALQYYLSQGEVEKEWSESY